MAERNDAWIKLWDAVPPEHRWIFEQTNEHYNAAFGSMLGAVLKALANIEENQTGFTHPLGALVASQKMITEHLEKQDNTLEALRTGQTVLRDEFQATGESIDQWRSGVEATLASHTRTLAAHDASRDDSIEERRELRADLNESKQDRKALHAELEESKVDRKEIRDDLRAYRTELRQELESRADAIAQRLDVRDAETTARLNDLAAAVEHLSSGINGRLTELIKSSESIARTEGRDAERAHPSKKK
jgi:chromosome segregation ATPase